MTATLWELLKKGNIYQTSNALLIRATVGKGQVARSSHHTFLRCRPLMASASSHTHTKPRWDAEPASLMSTSPAASNFKSPSSHPATRMLLHLLGLRSQSLQRPRPHSPYIPTTHLREGSVSYSRLRSYTWLSLFCSFGRLAFLTRRSGNGKAVGSFWGLSMA